MQAIPKNYLYIDDRFYIDMEDQLGEGTFGKVFRAYDQENQNNQICVKIIELNKFSQSLQIFLYFQNYSYKDEKEIISKEKRELKSMIALQNDYIPNMVKLIKYCQTKHTIYIFLEYCNGGTLRELLDKRIILTEAETIIILKQLSTTFYLLNQRNLIHRDVKPANILIHNEILYKISDFGFSRFIPNLHKSLLISCVGTPLYIAPELLLMQKSVEGIVAYEILFGRQPYIADNLDDLINQLKNQQEIEIKDIEGLPKRSRKIKDLIKCMLQKDQYKRYSWEQIINHELFKYNELTLLKNEQFLNSYLRNKKLTSSLMDQIYNDNGIRVSYVENLEKNNNSFQNNSGSQTEELMNNQQHLRLQQKHILQQVPPKNINDIDEDVQDENNNSSDDTQHNPKFKTKHKIQKPKKDREGNQEMYKQMKRKQKAQEELHRIVNSIQNFIDYKRNCYLFLDSVIQLLVDLYQSQHDQKLKISQQVFCQTIQGLLIYEMILIKNLILLLFNTNKPYFVASQQEWDIFLSSEVNNLFIFHIKNDQTQHEQYLKKLLDENQEFIARYPAVLNNQFKELLTFNIKEIILPIIQILENLKDQQNKQLIKLGYFLRYVLDFENGLLSLTGTKQYIQNFYEFYEKIESQINAKELINEFSNIFQ